MMITRPVNWLVLLLHSAVTLLSVFLLLRSAKRATVKFTTTAKLIEIICFVNFAVFNVCLNPNVFQILILKKILIFGFIY